MSKIAKRGFTLIELLVVIAIIGVLAAIVMVNLAPVTTQGNDAKRVADIKNLSLAIGLYYNDNGSYPATLNDLVTGGYMPSVPVDPVRKDNNGNPIGYDYAATTTFYVLRAELDSKHKVLDSDVDGNSPTDTLGLDCTDSPKYYYCVKP